MRTLYTSDTHYGHANIIGYSQRPFADVVEMDERMFSGMMAAFAGHRARLIHCGDFAWRDVGRHIEQFGPLPDRDEHVLVIGNHDRVREPADRKPFYAWFSKIVGTKATWRQNLHVVWDVLDRPVRVACTHEPLRDLGGYDYNVYGHVHNNVAPPWNEYNEGYQWLLQSPRHLNACVEMTGYQPRPLAWLVAERARLVEAWARSQAALWGQGDPNGT